MREHCPVSIVAVSIACWLALRDVVRTNGTSNYHFVWGFSVLVIPLPSRILRTIPKPSPTGREGSFLTRCRSRQSLSQPEEERSHNTAADEEEMLSSSLGINLGQDYSLALNETDREALRSQIKDMIHHRISTGILDLQQLHDRWERQVEGDLESLEQAMTLNGITESKRFATRLDSMVGKFWNRTAISRQKTKDLFYLDQIEQAEKAKEAEKRKSKRKQSVDGSFQTQSWKKTNDAWDDWDKDDW